VRGAAPGRALGRRAALAAAAGLALTAASCGTDAEAPRDGGPPGGADAGPQADPRTFDQCDADAPAFVRHAYLALAGRRPLGQAEVDVYAELYRQAAAQGRPAPEVVARAILARPEVTDRWVDAVMDALRVQRLDVQSEYACWGSAARGAVTPALAALVRDRLASDAGDGSPFTMLDLAQSAIALDDLTPIYRGQIFSLVSHPIPAANVPLVQAELARRADLGATFDAAYLHRDPVCLACHNSESSVTDDDEPDRDRHWPVPGAAERAVYGAPAGIAAERAHAVFRVRGLVGGALRPWGWATGCGGFSAPATIAPDPAGIDAKLASITGSRPTVFDLDAALRRGFEALRAAGAPAAPIADPDAALAWLVAIKITEDVWRQVTGTRLTIASYYPRNREASELLHALAGRLVSSGFSLKALLVAIVSSDYFARQPPDAACGAQPYTYPPVLDPWVIADADRARRRNSAGDAVTAIDGRTLISAVAGALEWPAPPGSARFPDFGQPQCAERTCAELGAACASNQCCRTYQLACIERGRLPLEELPFQRGVGLFLRSSEAGFRGIDFQARLVWEDRYGACTRPSWVAADFIDRLATAAAGDPGATVRDAIAALKDRLIGEPAIGDPAELAALTAIVGDLDRPGSEVGAAALRQVCGALLGSPQFLLQGIAGRGGDRPRLTPPAASFDAVCAALAGGGLGTPGLAVTCAPGALTLGAAPATPLRAGRPPPRGAPGSAPSQTSAAPTRAARDVPREEPLGDPRRVPAAVR
jgi:hypothetical protein